MFSSGDLVEDLTHNCFLETGARSGKRGEHRMLYRFSPEDYRELVAVFTGPHPETGEPLEVVDHAPEGHLPHDLPPEESAFAPDYAPEEIAEIAQRLRRHRAPARR